MIHSCEGMYTGFHFPQFQPSTICYVGTVYHLVRMSGRTKFRFGRPTWTIHRFHVRHRRGSRPGGNESQCPYRHNSISWWCIWLVTRCHNRAWLGFSGKSDLRILDTVYITSNQDPEDWYARGITPALRRRIRGYIGGGVLGKRPVGLLDE